MEHITSRKNRIVAHFKALSSDAAYRYEKNTFVCDGEKLLREALACGAFVTSVIWGDKPTFSLNERIEQFTCPFDLMQYASPLKNSRGPLFSVRMQKELPLEPVKNAVILENVQDPGNVGTVIRTANAMGVDVVVLTGECADVYNTKTVRSTMGAIFRQSILLADILETRAFVDRNGLKLYAAELSDDSADIRGVNLFNTAVAIGSEGVGLSEDILSICDGQIIIPMHPYSESLNAAVAASIVMWEMFKSVPGGQIKCH